MNRKLRFTIYHGIAVSLGLHSALALPFVLRAMVPPPEANDSLVMELQGTISDTQMEEKVQKETAGQPQQEEVKPEEKKQEETRQEDIDKPVDAPAERSAQEQPTPDKDAERQEPTPEVAKPVQQQMQSVNTDANDIAGGEQRQKAQKLADQDETARLRAYAVKMSKKLRAHILYPEGARQAGLKGDAKVSVVILQNGNIRLDSLKVVVSTGKPILDAAALKAVRSSAPFDSPPKEMTWIFYAPFGPK